MTTAQREAVIDMQTDPSRYRHWEVRVEPPLAHVTLSVDPAGGLRNDYDLKLNSYDLSVDIELHDVVQRLRFEHPEVHAVVLTSGLDKVFCAGANIQMLAGASHQHKVNFCKFTNETRNALEEDGVSSGQRWLAAINGTAAGGGYELAVACDDIVLIDDRASAVSLPEVPLLAVLPGTGGLTRVVDKRHVRRDLADMFSTRAEGAKAAQAVAWGLVDASAPRSAFADCVRERALDLAARSDRPAGGPGVVLTPLEIERSDDERTYEHVSVRLRRELGVAEITVHAPTTPEPSDLDALVTRGASSWVLGACRQLDDALVHLRFNEPALGTWVLRTHGRPAAVLGAERVLVANPDHWLVREIRLFWARTLKRLDLSARSLIAVVDRESAAAGTLAELVLAADRSFMLDDAAMEPGDTSPTLQLDDVNDGWYPMSNGISRLEARFWGHADSLRAARDAFGSPLTTERAGRLGLVTRTPDDIDWDDEIRVALEERNSFSPDALTGMEANLRFVGPETMESKIFSRLTAWQNWIFQRPNAVGPDGALHSYGSGTRPTFDRTRV